MAKDSAGATINLGDAIKIVGTVVNLSEPDSLNRRNVTILPTNISLKDNGGNVIGSDARTITISGSISTKGS